MNKPSIFTKKIHVIWEGDSFTCGSAEIITLSIYISLMRVY